MYLPVFNSDGAFAGIVGVHAILRSMYSNCSPHSTAVGDIRPGARVKNGFGTGQGMIASTQEVTSSCVLNFVIDDSVKLNVLHPLISFACKRKAAGYHLATLWQDHVDEPSFNQAETVSSK